MEFTTHTSEHKEIDFDLTGFETFLKTNKGLKIYEIDLITNAAIIDWQFYFEARSWGVKDVGAFATHVKWLDINVEYWKTKQDYEDGNENEINYDLTNDIQDFKVNSENDSGGKMFSIQRVEIDFEDKTITIIF
tara:strand:+ start:4974 stop:5375 length:402 start_codon:yes stop_codon:yes gene_type:complete